MPYVYSFRVEFNMENIETETTLSNEDVMKKNNMTFEGF